MDFNSFYHRRQVLLMRAHAAGGAAREIPGRLYSAQIAGGSAERGAGPATLPTRCGLC